MDDFDYLSRLQESPSKRDLEKSSSNLVSTAHTTLCDIICTLNTAVPKRIKSAPSSPSKSPLSASATLPYSERKVTNSLNSLNSPGRGGRTKFEEMKSFDIHEKRNNGLKRERDEFMWKLYSEKAEQEWLQMKCATDVQRVFRGCRSRGKGAYYLEKLQEKKHKESNKTEIVLHDLQDELCTFAINLKMSAIPGLSLEPRFKAGARRRKMREMAANHLITFFRMVVARTKARTRIEDVVLDKKNIMARRLVRFFRYIFARNFSKKAMAEKHKHTAVKIQTSVRSFLSYHRVRVMKRERNLKNRENEHSIVVIRNFKAHHTRKMELLRQLREEKAHEAVEKAEMSEESGIFEFWIKEVVGKLAADEHMAEIASKTVEEYTDGIIENILGDIATQAGIIRLEEQMKEMEEARLRMERERVELEKEKLRLEEESRMEEERAHAEEEAEDKAMDDYLTFAKKRAEEEGREVVPNIGSFRRKRKHFQALQVTISKRGHKQIYIASILEALQRADGLVDRQDEEDGGEEEEDKGEVGEEEKWKRLNDIDEAMRLGRSYYESGSFDSAFNAYSKLLGLLFRSPPKGELSDMDHEALLSHCRKLEMPPKDAQGIEYTCIALMAVTAKAIGDCLLDLYQQDSARTMLLFSRGLRELIYGTGHALVAEVDIALGRVYLSQARLNDAKKAFDDAHWALQGTEDKLQTIVEEGEDAATPAATAAKVNRRATHRVPGGEEDEELVFYLQILLYTGQGKLARYCGNYPLSAEYSNKALDACESVQCLRGGESHAFLSVEAKCNLAKLHTVTGDSWEAIRLYKEQLRVLIDVAGEEHPLTAAALIRLADASLLDAPTQHLLALVDKAIMIQRKYSQSLFLENGKLDIAKSLLTKGTIYMLAARYEEAQSLLEKSYEIRHELLGGTHPAVVHSIYHLAVLTSDTGHFPEALQNFDIVLHSLNAFQQTVPLSLSHNAGAGADASDEEKKEKEKEKSFVSFEAINALLGRALVWERTGQYHEALEAYELALIHRKAIVASLDSIRECDVAAEPDTSRSYRPGTSGSVGDISARAINSYTGNTPARANENTGGDSENQPTITTTTSDYGNEDSETAPNQNQSLTEKEREIKMGLLKEEKTYLPAVSVESVRVSVGRALWLLGSLQEANHVLSQAHSRLSALIGAGQKRPQPLHYFISEALYNLGLVSSSQGCYNDADELLDRAAEMKEKVLSSEHPEVAKVFLAMSDNLLGPGYYSDAAEVSEAAIAIAQKNFHHRSPFLISCLHNRANLLRDTSKCAEAEAHYQQALYFTRLHFSDQSPLFGFLLRDLAENQRRQKQYSEARETLKSCITLLTKHYGREHWITAQAILVLALVLKDEDKYEDALSMLQQHVVPVLSEGLGEENPWFVFAHGVLGICLKVATSDRQKEGGTDLEAHEKKILDEVSLEGEDYIDAALDYMDIHQQGPFDSKHPWVLALGGFASQPSSPRERADTARERRSLSARAGAAGASRSLGRASSSDSVGGIPLDDSGAMDTGSRPHTSISLLSGRGQDSGGASSSGGDAGDASDFADVRPFTAQSYMASRPATSQNLNDFLWTEEEYEAGHATRPTTGQRSLSAGSSSRPITSSSSLPTAPKDSPDHVSSSVDDNDHDDEEA